MALRQVRLSDDPLLRKKSRPVEEINERIISLAEDMIETMIAENGVGIAAPQVGVLRRLIVVDLSDAQEERILVMINPEILESFGECLDTEGCLSVPGKIGKVLRPERIKVEFLTLEKETKRMTLTGLYARIVCHEVDHLDGILYTDKLTDGKLYDWKESDSSGAGL